MGNKKIVILLPGYYEHTAGGAEYQTFLIAKTAKEAGFDVYHIFVPSEKKEYKNSIGINIIEITTVQSTFLRKFGHYIPLFCFPKTWRLLKKIKPDYIYCRGRVPQVALGAFYAKKHTSVKCIWNSASDRDVNLNQRINPMMFFDRISKSLLAYGIRNANILLAQTEYQRQQLKKNFKREAVLFYNLVPLPKETLEKDNVFTVVWVANFKRVKRPELFVELSKRFVDERGIRFIMIGRSGGFPVKDTDNLKYIGEQTNDEVDKILASAHVLVNTSEYEGFSNTFIQAWLRKTVVCSMKADPDSLLQKGLGVFCNDSIDDLEKAIRDLYLDKELLLHYSDDAYDYAIKNHSLEYNVNKIISIFE